jgi:iron complex transport system permease protein
VIFFGGFGFLGPGLGLPAIAIGAFLGGMAATAVVYRLATSVTGTSVSTMLLAGIAITALAGAVTSLFSFFADNEMLRRISLWQMGNLDSANWHRVMVIAAVVIPLVSVLPREGRALNAMLLGESEARHLGIGVEQLKRRLIVLTALGVGVAVAVSGVVAFVGLIVPHLVRLLIGPDHRYLIPGSALLGAVLLLLADTGARTLMSPAELPTGVITALLGAPFFVALLLRQRRGLVS